LSVHVRANKKINIHWILLYPKNDIQERSTLSIATSAPNLVKISQTAAELWTFSFFSKWRPSAILDFVTGQK